MLLLFIIYGDWSVEELYIDAVNFVVKVGNTDSKATKETKQKSSFLKSVVPLHRQTLFDIDLTMPTTAKWVILQ